MDAANRNGIRHVVFLSLQGVQFNTKTPHHAVEQYLKATNTPYTSLRPNFFMQNLSSTYADEIRDRSEIFLPAGRSRTALIDARDIGRVAATVLTEPGHVGKAYTLSGEHSLSYQQVASIMSEVLKRPITYARPSEADYLDHLAAKGLPADYIAVQKMIYKVVRLNASAIPNRAVRKLTGAAGHPLPDIRRRPPTSVGPPRSVLGRTSSGMTVTSTDEPEATTPRRRGQPWAQWITCMRHIPSNKDTLVRLSLVTAK